MDRTGRVEAVVHAGALETPYVRAGRGHPVLLIRDPAVGTGVWDLFFDRLAGSFTMVAPRLDPSAPPGGRGAPGPGAPGSGEPLVLRWLRELIEGLGLERPGVVTGPALGEVLDRARHRTGDWIGRVVILSPLAAPEEGRLPPAGVTGGPAAAPPSGVTERPAATPSRLVPRTGSAPPRMAGLPAAAVVSEPEVPTFRLALREWPPEAACESAGRFLEGGGYP